MKKESNLLILICIIITLCSCKKNDNTFTTPLPDIKINIAGQVTNENEKPVQGAVVTAYGQTTTSDALWLFVIKDVTVNSNRCVIEIKKEGFLSQYYTFKPTKAGRTIYVKPVIIEEPTFHNVTSATGGTDTAQRGNGKFYT